MSSSTESTTIATLLAALIEGQRAALAALEKASRLTATPQATTLRVPHKRWGMTPRRACELARSGAIEAVKIGKSYYATPGELERFYASHEKTAPQANNDDDVLEIARAAGRRAAR